MTSNFHNRLDKILIDYISNSKWSGYWYRLVSLQQLLYLK